MPRGRYGVDSLTLKGVESVDPQALLACLATRQRPSVSLELSVAPEPTCNKPPFDAERIHVPLWQWGFTDWPLYDPIILERDLQRIERWYRARGFYDIELLPPEADPPEALLNFPSDRDTVQLTLPLNEGEPVRVQKLELAGHAALPEALRTTLEEALELEVDDRFDEALYDSSKSQLLRILQDDGYADARVGGRVEIDKPAHAAFVYWQVEPGPFSEFGQVCVEGYGKLPPEMILQASGIKPGTPFSTLEVEDARTRIYQLRVFSQVEVLRTQDVPALDAERRKQPKSPEKDGAWVAWQSGNDLDDAAQRGRLCSEPEAAAEHPRVAMTIRVKPARLYRYGVGAGIQVGVEDGQRAIAATQQWDVHLTAFAELYNFLGGLRKLRLEDRPKLVFPATFPRVRSPAGNNVTLGNTLIVSLESPSFLERRTTLNAYASWDRGPDPFGGGFIRDDLHMRLGPQRLFLRNRLNVGLYIEFNPYFPLRRQDPLISAERYNLLFLRQDISWDGRDNRQRPRKGVFAQIEIHETLPPSDWRYVRLAPELRGYVPLPYGLVLAARFGLGALLIRSTEAGTEELRRLGPRPYRLYGGGAYSVRGVQAGYLGVRAEHVTPADGSLPRPLPGGTRSWIGSLELRAPLSQNLALAMFADVGDVDGGSPAESPRFRFTHPHTSLGGGVRYYTLVGPIRLDVGWLVPGLQGKGRVSRSAQQGRPLLRFNGAIHLTIGEAF